MYRVKLKAEGEFLQAIGIRRYKAAFFDRRSDKVIETDAVHDLKALTKEQRSIIEKEECENIDNYKRTIADGFIDTVKGEFLYREDLQLKITSNQRKKGGDMNKKCAICRVIFKVRKNAKTADTRTLCVHCRKRFKALDEI